MSEFQIEQGVPFPAQRSLKYPFTEMKVGDSFFIPGKKPSSMSGCWSYARKLTGFKFASRSTEGGVRVWRLE